MKVQVGESGGSAARHEPAAPALTQLFARRCFDGSDWLGPVLLTVTGAQISAVEPCEERQVPPGVPKLHCLVPGFIDVQVNGGGGVLLNQQPDVAALKQMSRAHLAYGTTKMLPTLITDDLRVMQQAADAVAALLQADPAGLTHTVAGIHFEGPHLSGSKPGIHPTAQIRPLSAAELALFSRKDIGIVMLTLAPETVSPEQISALCAQGVIVCLGHSNASYPQAMAAVAAGARGFTHLMNAMSPLTSREPGMVGAALTAQGTFSGLILDHHHLHPASARLMAQYLGQERLVLVTDAMAHTGSTLQQLQYGDSRIERRPASPGGALGGLRGSDKLCLPDGTLAGSALDMQSALHHLIADLQLSPELGLSACSRNPALLIQPALTPADLPFGVIRPGARADLLALDSDWQISQIWLGGVAVTMAEQGTATAAHTLTDKELL
ncbi:N-acetylglucosamine-6-phosphate deacetylase [Rheinheimera texasensis]|uniref:N-acetylglucosamine-6-phosphate deacetylase n=1 Tax=Rheinheimera texasensis TaxID=306205 RepID=UPI00068A0EF0|nr:N-acetylglucosamine-6-phosphate deacetylase [Rheinheimera texasensis]